MPNPVVTVDRLKVRRSFTAGYRPGNGGSRPLDEGEEFINYADKIRLIGDGVTPPAELPAYPLRPSVNDVSGLPQVLSEKAEGGENESITELRGIVPAGEAAPQPVSDLLGAALRTRRTFKIASDPAFGLDATGLTPVNDALAALLSQGGDIYIGEGDYLIDAGDGSPRAAAVSVPFTKDIRVTAHPLARFFTNGLDGRMIRFVVPSNFPVLTARKLEFEWVGGFFDQTGQKQSRVVPFTPAWQSNRAYAEGAMIVCGPSAYLCVTAGTSGGTVAVNGASTGGPIGTGSAIQDGTVVWSYVANPTLADFPGSHPPSSIQNGTRVLDLTKQGKAAVCDAISFAGTVTVGGVPTCAVRQARIADAKFYAGEHWQVAGGDSAIFIGDGIESTLVERCEFIGSRDLGIYGSNDGTGRAGGKHVYRLNKYRNCFGAHHVKRSIVDFEFYGHEFDNCIIDNGASQLIGPGTRIGRIWSNKSRRSEIHERLDFCSDVLSTDNVVEEVGAVDAVGAKISVYGSPQPILFSGCSDCVSDGDTFRGLNEAHSGTSVTAFTNQGVTVASGHPTIAAGTFVPGARNHFVNPTVDGLDRLGVDADGSSFTRTSGHTCMNVRLPYWAAAGAGLIEERTNAEDGRPIDMAGRLVNRGSIDAPFLADRSEVANGLYCVAGGMGSAKAWLSSPSGGLTASGTGQANALTLARDLNEVTTVLPGTGVRLPATAPGRVLRVTNAGANALRIYPATGEGIDSRATNAPFVLLPNHTATFSAAAAGLWRAAASQRVIAASAIQATATGTAGSDITLATVALPGGLLGPNDGVRISSLFAGTSNANTKNCRIRFGGQLILSLGVTTNANLSAISRVRNRGVLNSQVSAPAGQPGIGASGGSIITMAIDTTVDVPILFQANLTVATDTLDLHEYLVELT